MTTTAPAHHQVHLDIFQYYCLFYQPHSSKTSLSLLTRWFHLYAIHGNSLIIIIHLLLVGLSSSVSCLRSRNSISLGSRGLAILVGSVLFCLICIDLFVATDDCIFNAVLVTFPVVGIGGMKIEGVAGNKDWGCISGFL